MKTMSDIYRELDCCKDNLALLGVLLGPEHNESAGISLSPSLVCDGVYSVVQHLERILTDIEAIETAETAGTHFDNDNFQ